MNAKLPLWKTVVQFLPVKALVCVYTDLVSPKSLSLQLIGFCQMPSLVLCVCNFYNVNWTLKPFLYPYVQYLCYVGMAFIETKNKNEIFSKLVVR